MAGPTRIVTLEDSAHEATTSARGLMSASDKTKLDDVSASAAALSSTLPSDIGTAAIGNGTTAARSNHVHAHGNQLGGTLHANAVAAGAAGFMTGADKTKLDGIAASAAALTASTPAAVGIAAAAVGAATDAARADHVHAVTGMAALSSAVTGGEITATQKDLTFAFTPTKFIVQYRNASGAVLVDAPNAATIVGNAVRITLSGAGAPELVATDVVTVIAFA